MIINIVRKPFDSGVAENISNHSCGAINISAIRVGNEARTYRGMGNKVGNQENANGSSIYWMSKPPTTKNKREGASGDVIYEVEGRWPANVLISKDLSLTLDNQSGISVSSGGRIGNAQGVYSNQGRTGWGTGHEKGDGGFGDKGGASRFFKVVKEND